MFNTSIESTVVLSAVAVWFGHGWYLNTRLQQVHEKLDRVLESFDGLRGYLYEIDPQFDEERRLLHGLHESLGQGTGSLDGMHHMELTRQKRAEGRRTLNTSLTGE